MVLPGCRQLIDGGDRDLCFETASDEGAYHPCPALTIPPPIGGRSDFDFPQSRSHRLGRQLVGQIRNPIGVIGGDSPLPKLGRQSVRPPAPVGRPHLDETFRDPSVVDQIEILAARDRIVDLAGGHVPLLQLLDQLAPKVVSPRQQIQCDLIGGSLTLGHYLPGPGIIFSTSDLKNIG